MKTLCQKCIFADLANAEEPCTMNIINRIKPFYTTKIDDDGFNIIEDYRCLYGFDLVTYDKNKQEIGGIDKLTSEIYKRCEIPYYITIFATEDTIPDIVKQMKLMPIKPKYLSLILFASNNTAKIIDVLKDQLSDICEWKLHNFLQEEPREKALNIVFDTNKNKNQSQYAWIVDSNNMHDLDKQIADINEIMTITKPKAHMLCRTPYFSLDGLFIAFDNFRQLCKENEQLISEGVTKNIEHILIHQY
jgi:hypothetical protein